MATVRIFDQLRARVVANKAMLPMERRAQFWFHEYSSALRSWQRTWSSRTFNQLVKDDFSKRVVPANTGKAGFFYFFIYASPIGMKRLTYYDEFPFVLILDITPNSYLGLNFHYLSYDWRARFFDALWPLRDGDPGKSDDQLIELRATYDLLVSSTKYKFFQPCIKRYRIDRIGSPLLKVGASEWDCALFLPVESFAKSSVTTVWSDSQRKFS